MRFPEPYETFDGEPLEKHESSLELEVECRRGHTCVARRKCGGHLSASRQILSDTEPASFYIINTAGGIVQGDRLNLDIKVGSGCSARILSQSANKIYRMESNCAAQYSSIELDKGARLEYVPEPNIPYARSRYFQYGKLMLHRGSTLFYWDVLYPGRYGRGERFDRCVYFSRLDAFIDGEPALVDTVFIDPDRAWPLSPGIMGGRRFQANAYIYADDYGRLEKYLKGYSHCVNAAGMLLIRLLEDDALAMRKKLERLHRQFNMAYGP